MRNMKPVWKYGIIALIDLLIISVVTIISVFSFVDALSSGAPYAGLAWFAYMRFFALPPAAVRGIVVYLITKKVCHPSLMALIVTFPCFTISLLIHLSFISTPHFEELIGASIWGILFSIAYSTISFIFSLIIGFAYRKFSN